MNREERILKIMEEAEYRYEINGEDVTKEEYIRAEQRNGFHSKFGPDHPATASFGNSATGDHGRVTYVRKSE